MLRRHPIAQAIKREAKRLGLGVRPCPKPRRRHLRLILTMPDGSDRFIVFSNSPSDHRAPQKARQNVRRIYREFQREKQT